MQRGRVSELMKGRRRRGTAYMYRTVWGDFAAFLEWRLGDGSLAPWASSSHAERHAETPRLHAYLDEHVGEVSAADVQAYVEAMLQRPVMDRRGRKKVGLENSTINMRLSALRHLFRTAVRMGLRTDNPADPEHVSRRRVSTNYAPAGPPPEEVRRLLDALGGDSPDYLTARDRMVILLLARLGLRREETCELRADSVREAPPAEGGLALDLIRKGDKHAVLLLPLDVGEALVGYVERWGLAGYLFVACPFGAVPGDLATAAPMSPDDVTVMVRERTGTILDKAYSPHAFRHAFVTLSLDAGAALHEVQHFVGHASPATTERYITRRLSRKRSPAEVVSYEDVPQASSEAAAASSESSKTRETSAILK